MIWATVSTTFWILSNYFRPLALFITILLPSVALRMNTSLVLIYFIVNLLLMGYVLRIYTVL